MNKELTAIQAKAQAILDKQAQEVKKVTDAQKQLDADRQKLEDERGKALVAGDLSGYRSAKEALEELEDRGEILSEQLRLAKAPAADPDTYKELLEKTRATISVERQKVVTEMRQHFAAISQVCDQYNEFCSDAEKVLQFLQHKLYQENLEEGPHKIYNAYREQRITDAEFWPWIVWRETKRTIRYHDESHIFLE